MRYDFKQIRNMRLIQSDVTSSNNFIFKINHIIMKMMEDRKLEPIVHPEKNKKNKKKTHEEVLDKALLNFAAIQYEATETIKVEMIENVKKFVETDLKFIKSVAEIAKSRESVLKEIMDLKKTQLTDQRCDEIHYLAKAHAEANIINQYSHKNGTIIDDEAEKSRQCDCGCLNYRGDSFEICKTNIQEINILGSGVLLFFLFLKSVTILTLIFALIYAIFAMATNLMGQRYVVVSSSCTSSYCTFRDRVSDYNKWTDYENVFENVQTWLGLGAMVIWGIGIRFVKIYGEAKDRDNDAELTSSSDLALKIDNLPYGDYSEDEIVQYLEKLFKNIRKKYNKEKQINQDIIHNLHDKISKEQSESNFDNEVTKNPLSIFVRGAERQIQENKQNQVFVGDILQAFTPYKFARNPYNIKAVQIVYNMEFSRKLVTKTVELTLKVNEMLQEKHNQFSIIDSKDQQKYIQAKKELIEMYELFEDLRKKFLAESKFRKSIATTCCLIEFQNYPTGENGEKKKDEILNNFGKERISFIKQLSEYLKNICWKQNSEIVFKGNILTIERAPEPSDILWENCQKRQSVLRKLVIYLITFLIILISFGITGGLQYVQKFYGDTANSQGTDSSVATVINVISSLVMQIVNKLLWFSLFYLLDLEYNHSNTNKIISQMNKSTFLMWINVIVLPIIVNYVFQGSLYGASGLSGIVYDYHITALTVNLILKLINPVPLIVNLLLSIRACRNWIIKARYRKSSQDEKNEAGAMRRIYTLYEGEDFAMAEYYIFIITNLLHAAFFCHLQPFILVLVTLQAFFFYWICKIRILKFCKIPGITQRLIYDAAIYLLLQLPIFYGVGGIFVSYVSNQNNPNRQFYFIGSAICIGVALLHYINPGNFSAKIFECLSSRIDCINPEKILQNSKQKQRQNAKEQLEESNKEDSFIKMNTSSRVTRLQNYYKESNSLTLLGFENKLLGGGNQQTIVEELQNFCKSQVNMFFDSIEEEVQIKQQ